MKSRSNVIYIYEAQGKRQELNRLEDVSGIRTRSGGRSQGHVMISYQFCPGCGFTSRKVAP